MVRTKLVSLVLVGALLAGCGFVLNKVNTGGSFGRSTDHPFTTDAKTVWNVSVNGEWVRK